MQPVFLIVRAAIVGTLFTLLGCSSVKEQGPPTGWNTVNGGMTREEISKLIGPPTQTSAAGRDIWVRSGWQLEIGYDEYGRARNILSQPLAK